MSLFQTANYRLCFGHYNEKASNKLFFFQYIINKLFTLWSYQEKDQMNSNHLEPNGVSFNFQP